MPARAARRPIESIDELVEQNQIEEWMLKPGDWEKDWKALCERENFNVEERLSAIPAPSQQECHAYLYRLWPVVRNQGPYTNIEKYIFPPVLTFEDIKRVHGGGKYNLKLKRGAGKFSRTLGDWTFSLEGPPRYLEGQKDKEGNPLPVGSADNGNGNGRTVASEAAELVKALTPLFNPEGKTKAADVALDVVSKGYTSVMDAQAKAAAAPNELLMKVVERALTQPSSALGPEALMGIIDKVFSVANKMNPRREDTPANGNPVQQLDAEMNLLEKVTGKAFSELIGIGEGKTPKVDPLVQFGITLVGALPTLFQQFRQFKTEEFQRQAFLQSKGINPQPAPIPTAPATEVQPPPPPNFEPNPAIPPIENAPLQGVTQQQMVEMVIAEFCAYYRAGWDGYACATSLAVHFGESLQMLAPILSDRMELDKIVETVPALKELESLAREEGQPTLTQFVDQFFDTLNPPKDEEGEEEEDEAESLPVAKVRKKKKAEEAKLN